MSPECLQAVDFQLGIPEVLKIFRRLVNLLQSESRYSDNDRSRDGDIKCPGYLQLTSRGPVFSSVQAEAVVLMLSLGSSHDTAKYIANESVWDGEKLSGFRGIRIVLIRFDVCFIFDHELNIFDM